MDWARPVSYSGARRFNRPRPRDRGHMHPTAWRRCHRTASTSAVDANVLARCQPPLSPLAIKAPDGRSFLPFCATFPQHRGKLPLTARYRLAVALSHHSSIPGA
jgi:hypothetical protein